MSEPAQQSDCTSRVKQVFALASDLPTDQRAAFLDQQTSGNAALRAAVESLLAAHEHAGQFLAGPTVQPDALPGSPGEPAPPRRIGPYKLLQEIGEGGFGTVYLAEQEHPVRRRVALKLIKLGMDTKQVIARFEAERQALAMMDHPNIARVLDAGTTEEGRPYFVMELVRGVPVTEYADASRLSLRQRLELFVPVCQAVQHAHQKGIIHRDLKPSNVLVTLHDGTPVPKVIDFGVAKATQARLTEKTLFTEFRQMIGTPVYMSPEQAQMSGLDVDTRSDVYALGVLLYELLTGTTPFDPRELNSKAYAEMQRVIREVDPPRPSTRLSRLQTLAAIAATRGSDPGKLRRAVRGELDWIVMKCLEKDRSRRYESASALASDVTHYLSDEPVNAVAPSRLYRVRKFVRRNRAAVAAVSVILLLLVGGITGTTIGMIRAARQSAVAESERRIAEAVGRFQSDMLSSADPARLLGDRVTVLQAVTAAVAELDAGKLHDQPLVEASVRLTIGDTLRALGRYDAAEPNVRRALVLRRAGMPPLHPGVAQCLNDLGRVLHAKGNVIEAEAAFRESLSIYERGADPDQDESKAACLSNLGLLLRERARAGEAETLLRSALAIRRGLSTRPTHSVGSNVNNLALVLADQGKFEGALALMREALEAHRRDYPAGHPDIGQSLNNVAGLLCTLGRYVEAEPLYREALQIKRKTLPADHPEVARVLCNLGALLKMRGELDEPEAHMREALQIFRRSLPADHTDAGLAMTNLAALLHERGRLDEAEALFREAVQQRRRALPATHPELASSLNNFAALLGDRGKHSEAEALYREALDIQRRSLPEAHTDIGWTLNQIASLLEKQGKTGEAEALFRESLSIRKASVPPGHPDIATSQINLANLLGKLGRHADAEPLCREGLASIEASFGREHWRTGHTRVHLGRILLRQARLAEAEIELLAAERVLADVRATHPDRYRRCLEAVVTLYETWNESGPNSGHDAKAREWRMRLEGSATRQGS
jgi:serine/threonine protein kinase/tetratricopeptide (TPR) repeat protein